MTEYTERVYRACVECASSKRSWGGFDLNIESLPVSAGEIKSLIDKQGVRISNRAVRNHLRRLIGEGLTKKGKDGWHLTEKGARPLRMADTLSGQDDLQGFVMGVDPAKDSGLFFDGGTLTIRGDVKK